VAKGEAAELWFSGQHVHPAKALATGYTFKHPDLEPALEDVL
jgi:NAD dependent epimerase/dehydratase family enzyme